MELKLDGLGKRYHGRWLFRELTVQIASNSAWVIRGNNGSGKSTLLQILFRYINPTKGSVTHLRNDIPVAESNLMQHTAFVAPYIELPEELTLLEVIHFHFSMRKPVTDDWQQCILESGLNGNENKQVRYFSSGMKQRLKLLLAFNTEADLLLLDEPCSNLDAQGISWYCDMVAKWKGKRTLIVASNVEEEYRFCDHTLRIGE